MAQSLKAKDSINGIGGLKAYFITLYTGYILFTIGLVRFWYYPEISLGLLMIVLGLIQLISALVILWVRVYQIWRFIINTSLPVDFKPSITSPGCAVGYLFIPLFNFYWVFIAIGRLPRDLNLLARSLGINSRVPSRIGLSIAIIAIISIVPNIGWFTAAVNALLLIPILLSSSIALCREAAEKISFPEGNGAGITVTPERTKLRNFHELFDYPGSGFRWGVLIAFIVLYIFPLLAIISSMFPLLFVLNGPFFQILLARALLGVLAGFLFIILCKIVKKDWLLAPIWGLVFIPLVICNNYIPRFIYTEQLFFYVLNYQPEFHISARMIITSFLWGFAFMASLILVVRFWGLRLWSLAAGLMIISLVFNIRQWFFNIFSLDIHAAFFLILPIVQYCIMGILLYFALRPPSIVQRGTFINK